MKLNVNPTRMELLKLRKRVRFAERGHKLLKDKEEQLLIEFRTLIGEVKKKREITEKKLLEFYAEVLKIQGTTDENVWESLIDTPFLDIKYHTETKRIFNIPVTQINFESTSNKESENYMISPYFQHLLSRGQEIMTLLLELSFLENKLISFASEIERTRRRVNALEFVLIPNINDTIKFISFKLNENERTSLVTLKHIQLTRQES